MKIPLLTAALLAASPLTVFADVAVPTPPATIVAPAAPAVTPAAPTATLRLKFALGQTHRYKMTMLMDETILTGQSGAGIPMNMKMVMTMRQTIKDIRATDGAATVEAQIEAMTMTMNGNPMPMTPEQLAPMKQPFTSVILPTGKVLSFQMPTMPTGGVPGMDLRKGLSTTSVPFPDGPVKVGDSWTGTVAMAQGINLLTTATLAGLDTTNGGQIATINQKIGGDINMTLSKNTPMTMKMTGTMTGSGTQVFDVADGALTSQNMVMGMNFLMKFLPNAGQPAPAGMPSAMKMTMKETIAMQRIEDSAPAIAPVQ